MHVRSRIGPTQFAQSFLSAVIKWARHSRRLDIPERLASEARENLKHRGLETRSSERERERTDNELDRLYAYWRANTRQRIDMPTICSFALATGMRLGEICRLQADNVDRTTKTMVIRDRKDPRAGAYSYDQDNKADIAAPQGPRGPSQPQSRPWMKRHASARPTTRSWRTPSKDPRNRSTHLFTQPRTVAYGHAIDSGTLDSISSQPPSRNESSCAASVKCSTWVGRSSPIREMPVRQVRPTAASPSLR